MRNTTQMTPTTATKEKQTMCIQQNRLKLRPAWRGAMWTLALPLLGACDIQAILEVDIPGRVEESALENPKLASTLVTGVISRRGVLVEPVYSRNGPPLGRVHSHIRKS